jgi:hypothetical protein
MTDEADEPHEASETEGTSAAGRREPGDRIGTLAMVGVVLFALLTVGVVVFTRQDATAEAGGPGDGPAPSGSASTAGSARPRAAETPGPGDAAALAEVWRAADARVGAGGAAAGPVRLWPGDGTLTLVTAAGVTGLDVTDGTARWEGAPPPGADRPCAAAARPNAAGVGAVFWTAADDGACSVLGVVDTTNGGLLWSWRFTGEPRPEDVTVTVGDAVVSAGLDQEGSVARFHRFGLADGEPLPLPGADGGQLPACADGAERQVLAARHAGARVLMRTRCPEAQGPGDLSVHHADTGEVEWTHSLTGDGFRVDGVVAGDPVVLRQGAEVVAYGETGAELWRLPAGGPGATWSVAGEVLVRREEGTAGTPTASTASTAFTGWNLADGRELWTIRPGGVVRAHGTDDAGRLLLSEVERADGAADDAAREDGGDDVVRLSWLDPVTGALTDGGTVPADPRRLNDEPHLAFDGHQLYVAFAVARDGEERLRLRAYERWER